MRNKMVRDLFPTPPPPKEPSGGLVWGMMLCLDDPLRDTPEKAERYARFVHALSETQRATASEADVAAALKVIAGPYSDA